MMAQSPKTQSQKARAREMGESRKTRESRRRFLKAVGAGALALPFYRALEESFVQAQTDAGPLRFVGVYHPHGASSPLFRRRAEDTETAYQLNFIEPLSGAQSVLAPFDDPATYGTTFKDKIIVLDGLDFVAGQGGHDAPGQILTGAGRGEVEWSLDQFLAVGLGLGGATRLSSLSLGVGNKSTDYIDTLSFGQGGSPLPKIIDPEQTFDLTFADAIREQDPAEAARLERMRREGQSVIDFVRDDINQLYPRLAAREAQKLDQHLTSLRDLEKRLQAFGATCTLPGRPTHFDRLERYNQGEPNFNALSDLQIDMLAQALACDLTRFGTLWLADLSSGAIAGTGIAHARYNDAVDVHNSIAHTYAPPRDSHFGSGSSLGDPASWEVLSVQQSYSYGKCARFLQRLSEFGVLDNTLVMISTDMGDPSAHSSRNVPIILAGGAGGALAMGRHLQLKQDCPADRFFCNGAEQTTIPHNLLLTSLANLFGANLASFGNTTGISNATGGLPELG